jgi:hypothetical protein
MVRNKVTNRKKSSCISVDRSTNVTEIVRKTYAILVSFEPATALARHRIRNSEEKGKKRNQLRKSPKRGDKKTKQNGKETSSETTREQYRVRVYVCTVGSSSQRKYERIGKSIGSGCQGFTCTRRRETRKTPSNRDRKSHRNNSPVTLPNREEDMGDKMGGGCESKGGIN